MEEETTSTIPEDFLEPTFLNVEYFFNSIFSIFVWFKNVFLGILGVGGAGEGEGAGAGTQAFFETFIPLLKFFLTLFTILLIAGIIYALVRLYEIRKQEALLFAYIEAENNEQTQKENERWIKITKLISSTSPSDWKVAIIESDMMLEEIVEKMGYQGENLGEKLKTIEKSDFQTLELAWEAHKTRNRIAHESHFSITHKEAKHTIDLYEEVFREFHYI